MLFGLQSKVAHTFEGKKEKKINAHREKCKYFSLKMETQLWKLLSGYGYFFLLHEKTHSALKETSHQPRDPHIHCGIYDKKRQDNIFCLVMCELYSGYKGCTSDVAILLETFSFKNKGFYSMLKNNISIQGRFPMPGSEIPPNVHYNVSRNLICILQ